MLTVILDPGHGGHTKTGGSSANNAVGPGGTLEKNLTLAVAKAAKQKMPPAIETILTRSDDSNLGLWHRADLANRHRADIFISIHFNGFHLPSVQGTETYHYPSANSESQSLAALVQSNLVAATGYRNRGVKQAKFGAINPSYHFSRTAACLTEISFMTDPSDEQRLSDPSYIAQLGGVIADACVKYLAGQYLSTLSPPQPGMAPSIRSAEPQLMPGDAEDAASENLAMSEQDEESELEAVNGIGPVMAESLDEAGVSTLQHLASVPDAHISAIADAVGTSETMLKDWISQAKDLL